MLQAESLTQRDGLKQTAGEIRKTETNLRQELVDRTTVEADGVGGKQGR